MTSCISDKRRAVWDYVFSPSNTFCSIRKTLTPKPGFIAGAVVLCAATVAMGGENLLEGGDFEVETVNSSLIHSNSATLAQENEEKAEGDSSMRVLGAGWLEQLKLIEVDPHQSYSTRVLIKEPSTKMAPGDRVANVGLGLRLYDAEKNMIPPFAVAIVEHTETTLASAAPEGSIVLHLKGDVWDNTGGRTAVAFDVQSDLSDLPNFHTAEIRDISSAADGFEVHLLTPLDRGYAEGTAVRQHVYADFPSENFLPDSGWQEHVLDVGGVSEPGIHEPGRFWYGTFYVRPVISIRIADAEKFVTGEPCDLLIDNWSFSITE